MFGLEGRDFREGDLESRAFMVGYKKGKLIIKSNAKSKNILGNFIIYFHVIKG